MQFGGPAGEQLRRYISRIEQLEESKAELAADIREVMGQAKADGFDTKALRAVLKIRKMEPSERQEQEAILDTYLHALGMLGPSNDNEEDFPDTPSSEAAEAEAEEKEQELA